MAASEVRVQLEGTLWWVRGSGSGNIWATASAPVSGLAGYVQSFSFTSALTLATMSDRGIPTHHKIASKQPIQVTFQCLWTGVHPSAVSGSGASVPFDHLEFKALVPEDTAIRGAFYQFMGFARQQLQFTEQAQGDTIQFQGMALGMVGPTASGYLS